MTLNDLKNDVARLGFESYVEDEAGFIASANRALAIIYTDRPVSRTAKLSFRGPKACLVREFIEHRSGTTQTIPFTGSSISFRSTGKGRCIITDQSGSNSITLANDGQLTKQDLYGSGSITFEGDYYFTISNLAVFDDKISNSNVDIPEYTPFVEMRPEEYCDDFRAFKDLPHDKNGTPIDSLKLIDGRIRAPFNFRDEIYLTYYRAPRLISENEPNAAVDVSKECEPMLALLTASFAWLDEDAAKAQYYMSLYRDMMANVRRYSTNKVDAKYSVNGWA